MSEPIDNSGQLPEDEPVSRAVKKPWTLSRIYSIASIFIAFWLTRIDSDFNIVVFLFWWFTLWVIGLPFRFIGWIQMKLTTRPCFGCGLPVSKGQTTCNSCGFDFLSR